MTCPEQTLGDIPTTELLMGWWDSWRRAWLTLEVHPYFLESKGKGLWTPLFKHGFPGWKDNILKLLNYVFLTIRKSLLPLKNGSKSSS